MFLTLEYQGQIAYSPALDSPLRNGINLKILKILIKPKNKEALKIITSINSAFINNEE
jgi:hypothetical protein